MTASLESVADLRQLYVDPGARGQAKVITTIDDNCRSFLAHSPFFVLATADADGRCDASPKGGPPGFVQVLDEHRLAWADLSGNNRLDSFQNLVTNDHVALLFLIPGLDETLRVNGAAELVTDPELGRRVAVDGKPAQITVVVTIAEAYVHCAKALRRAELWSSDQWLPAEELPSAACMIKDHVGLDVDVEVIAAARERDVQENLWRPGGAAGEL